MMFASRIEPGSQALSAVGFMPAIWCSFVKSAWEARIILRFAQTFAFAQSTTRPQPYEYE